MTQGYCGRHGAFLIVVSDGVISLDCPRCYWESASASPMFELSPLQKGERYVGGILLPDGTGHHIIRMAMTYKGRLNHHDAMKYAADNGGELPDRVEIALLNQTKQPGEFEDDWYWTRETFTNFGSDAWCQSFGVGYQSIYAKNDEWPVVLVRRVPIQFGGKS